MSARHRRAYRLRRARRGMWRCSYCRTWRAWAETSRSHLRRCTSVEWRRSMEFFSIFPHKEPRRV